MNDMMMLHFKKRLVAVVCFLLFSQSAYSAILLPDTIGVCDSLFLSNGRVVTVKNLRLDKEEISFAYCDDVSNKMQTAPWMQIHHIKKADGTRIDSPAQVAQRPSLTKEEEDLENQVMKLHQMALWSIPLLLFVPLGFILAIMVLAKSNTLRRAVIGHPNEAWLLKRIKRSRRIVQWLLFSWILLGLLLFGYIIYFFSLFDQQ